MNKYRITKIVYADDVSEVESIVKGGETLYVELLELNQKNDPYIGFIRQNDNR